MNKAWSKDKDHKEDEDCEPCQALKIFKASRPLLNKPNINNTTNNTSNTTPVSTNTTNTNTTSTSSTINTNNNNTPNNSDNKNDKINNTKETPPDLLELGRSTWTLLHTVAAYYPDKPSPQKKENVNNLINDIAKFSFVNDCQVFPCNECATDFQEVIKTTPPKLDSRQDLAVWMCQAHNHVNERLGKEPFDCSLSFLDNRWKYDLN